MHTPQEQHELELQFRALVSNALDERWQRDGRYSAKDILTDIRTNDEVWQAMAEHFAQRAAVIAIRHQMATRDPAIDPAQERFPFAKELPVPSIMYKGSVVSTLRSTADEYLWFSRWYERRHNGTVKRSKYDKKTLARIQRFARIIEKYQGDDPTMTVQRIFQVRQERLEALRQQRKTTKRTNR